MAEGLYSELRSKFIAYVIPVRTEEEALAEVARLRQKYYDARHVCWAYRLGIDGATTRSNDDGEPSGTAGKPILGQLLSANVTEVVAVVIRYFGGVKLGISGLIELIERLHEKHSLPPKRLNASLSVRLRLLLAMS